MTRNTDPYETITQQIIDDVTSKELHWKAWWSAENLLRHELCPRHYDNVPFTGKNAIALFSRAIEKHFRSPYWLSFRQVVAFRGTVSAAAQPSVVLCETAQEQAYRSQAATMRHKADRDIDLYKVFNADQIEGLPLHFYGEEAYSDVEDERRMDDLDLFFGRTGAITKVETKPSYSPFHDTVYMPPFSCFDTPAKYYATLAHELIHWTGNHSRLNRTLYNPVENLQGYAKEELIAELGSSFLAIELGLECRPLEHHAAYIQSWLKDLNNNPAFIQSASEAAEKAVRYICTFTQTFPYSPAYPLFLLHPRANGAICTQTTTSGIKDAGQVKVETLCGTPYIVRQPDEVDMKRANILNPATGLPVAWQKPTKPTELFSEPVLAFLNALPQTTDTYEWCEHFKRGLTDLLPDVDLVAISVRPTVDFDDPENDQRHKAQEIQKIYTPNGSVRSRIYQKSEETEPWIALYNLAKEGHLSTEDYHMPIGIDYYYRGRSHIASLLLFRRRSASPTSVETILLMEKLEPFFVNIITAHIRHRRLERPHELNFRDVVERIEGESKLTQRESEAAALLLCGHSNQEIADAMQVSKTTADKHIASVYRKSRCANVKELMARYLSPDSKS